MGKLFNEIANKRRDPDTGLIPMRPLWKLKITTDEFEEIRRFLYSKAGSYSDNRFEDCQDECMLYFAMYWQRICLGGSVSKEDVVNSLGQNVPEEVSLLFYKAAREAFKKKGMPVFQDTYTMWFRCMLYQGGLPLNAICGEEENAWKRFARKLVKGEINLENPDLNLGATAENYQPLRQFAEDIYNGLITNDPSKMPFWCPDINNEWYQGLDKLRIDVIKREREENPFPITQVMALDEVSKRIFLAFQVEAPKILPSQYTNKESIELKIEVNGILKHPQTYVDGFNRNALKKRFKIDEPNDVISLKLDEELIEEKEFDLSEPSFFYLTGINKGNLIFQKTNTFRPEIRKIGIIPENWEVEDKDLKINIYNWNDSDLRILDIPADRKEKIILIDTSTGETYTFGKDNPSYDSVIRFRPVFQDYVISPVLFNSINDSRGYVIIDQENGTRKDGTILYSKDKLNWSTVAPCGKIYAKVNLSQGQTTSIKTLYNISGNLEIKVIESTPKKCLVNVSWDKGQVTCKEDRATFNCHMDAWEIYQDNLASPWNIRFTLIPVDGNPFQITIRAPFRQLTIIDGLGNKIHHNDYIPYTDYDLYRYIFFGQDRLRLQIGDETFRLFSSDTEGLRKKEGEILRDIIPYSGSLSRLIGSREEISLKFDEQCQDIINTQLNVELGDNNEIYRLHIKENPYKLKYNPKTFVLTLHNPDAITSKRKFQHRLYVLKLNEPKEEPIILNYEEGGEEVILPEELREIPNLLIIGKTPGRIIPKLINRPKQLANDNHTNSPTPAKQETPQEMRKRMRDHYGELFDKNYLDSEVWEKTIDWFFTCAEYGLPYTTLIQLEAIPEKSTRLIKFLFSCLFSERIDKDTFVNNLQQMARDCSFKWFWLLPYLNNNNLLAVIWNAYNPHDLPQFITNDILDQKREELIELLKVLIEKSIEETTIYLSKIYSDIAKKLYDFNALKGYFVDDHENDFLNLIDIRFFTTESNEFPEVNPKFTVNEKWVERRAKCFAEYMIDPFGKDIFILSLEAKKSLRLLYKQAPHIFWKRTFLQLKKLAKK